MRFKRILSAAASVLYWASAVAKTYENQKIVIDGVALGTTTFEDDELLVLKNSTLTLNNFMNIKLPAGISLTDNSVLNINTPPDDTPPSDSYDVKRPQYSMVINGKVSIDNGSQFVFDGSSLVYSLGPYASEKFLFDINTGMDGIFISKDSTMRITLPKYLDWGFSHATTKFSGIHIGGTYKAPYNSPLVILGTLEVLRSDSRTDDGYFDDNLFRIDLGPDKIDENGVFTMKNDLSGNIHCQGILSFFADIFKGTDNVFIRTIGFQAISPISPITVDLAEGPVQGNGYLRYNVIISQGQGNGLKLLNLQARLDIGLPIIYIYNSDNYKDLTAKAHDNVIDIIDHSSNKSFSIIGDRKYNITYWYQQYTEIYPSYQYGGYFKVPLFKKSLQLDFIPIIEPDYTTTIDKGNGDFETDLVSHITTKDYYGKTITITTTIPLHGPAPPAVTKTVDLGNEVTEYLVISYWTTTNEFGGLITTNSTATYSPPPVTVTATTASDYIESDWISFFITTDEKGDIVTSSTLFNATRDYNLPEAPHTSFGPAPPAVTKTVDLGNEVTEYLVISYWTTTNEFGGLITTNSTATYSPPPVTVTATTASDYIESDWISFFITTDEKGDIVTSSTLFNATRDYIDPQAPYTSSSSYSKSKIEQSDYTTTIDKGNGDFETDLVSHITTKDSDGKPTTITTTIPLKPSDAGEADYTTTIDKGNGDFETDLVSHITTKDSDGKPTTITTTIPLKPSDAGEADYTTTIDKGNGDFETDLVSHITTKDSDGKPTTITTTIPLKPSDAGEADYT
ncbi:hypothetical protein B1J92_A04873g, partial [Nakaseomyces glabratus]